MKPEKVLSVSHGTSGAVARGSGRWGRRPNRDPKYSAELKTKALKLADEGKSVAALARELGVPYKTIYAWVRVSRLKGIF